MMKKKNIAMAMAAVTVAGVAAPAAAFAAETEYNITTNEYATLEAKIKEMLATKYTTTAGKLEIVDGVAAGGSVFNISMKENTSGAVAKNITNLEELTAVSKDIKNSNRGRVFNFTIVDNGHTVDSDNAVVNKGKVKYTISTIAKVNEQFKNGIPADGFAELKNVADTVEKTYNESNGTLKLTFKKGDNSHSVTLEPGMEALDFNNVLTEGNGATKKLVGFRPAITKINKETYTVSVANAKVESVRVTESNAQSLADELNGKYTFEAFDKSQIKELNGKFQLTLFVKGIKEQKAKSVARSLAPEGTLTQIVLTANTKAELETLVAAMKGNADFTTINGVDRMDTAIKISEKNYNDKDAVVLVGQYALVDGLAAAPLASAKDAPVLLTGKDSLSKELKTEIKRVLNLSATVRNKVVYIVGGEAVVSKNVVKELEDMGLTVKRLAGDDRAATSTEVAKEVIGTSALGDKNVYVVGGYGLADAMSIAPVAAKEKAPILVVDKNQISTDAVSILSKSRNGADIIGGETVVAEKAFKQVANAAGNAERVAGEDRQETNAKVIKKYFTAPTDMVYVAKDGYAKEDQLVDALAIAPSAQAPIVLATNNVTVEQAISINAVKKNDTKLTQVGGGVAKSVIDQIKNVLGLK